jgi:hypothetical protein
MKRTRQQCGSAGAQGGASALGEALSWDIDVETYSATNECSTT